MNNSKSEEAPSKLGWDNEVGTSSEAKECLSKEPLFFIYFYSRSMTYYEILLIKNKKS
jgi:hypothetical protein